MAGLAALVVLPAVADPEIEVIGLSEGRFQLTLKVDEAIDLETGSLLLLPTALEVCGELAPRFGKYRFSGKEAVDNPASTKDSFVLVQQIECGGAPEMRQDEPASRQLGDEERSKIKQDARARTVAYHKALAEGRDQEVLAMFPDFSASATPSEQSPQERDDDQLQEQADFRAEAGALGEVDVWRVTLYVDPPSAPQTGIYVATDIEVSYENLTICGYFVWLESADGTLLINRREVGKIAHDVVEKMSDAQLARVRRDFRCRPETNSQ